MVEDGRSLAETLRDRRLRAERVSVLMHAVLAVARTPTADVQMSVPPPPRGAEEAMTTRLLRHEVRALRAFRTRRRATAYQHIRDGLAELHDWQSAYGSLDLQSSLVGHGRGLARLGLEQAVADGRPEVLFEWSERARALVARVPSVRAPGDPEAVAELAELRRSRPGSPEERALRDHIRQQAWFREGAGEVLEPLGLADVQASLGDTALVSHVIAGGRLVALVATADRADVVDLGPRRVLTDQLPAIRADLDMVATKLPEQFRAAIRGDLEAKLERAGSILVGPLSPYVEDRRVVLVPSARLAGTPWTLLPGFRGRPLTVARSASEWATQREWVRPERAGFVPGPKVERATGEVSACAAAWRDGARVLPEDAGTDEMARLATTVDVLHVAAHGRHAVENPLFSEIELSGGPWFGYDVEALPRVPDVVVLSACDLGVSSVRWAEEQVGMAAAWLHAGARSVLASPAALNDDLACALQPAFHTALAAGTPPADALAGLAELGDLPLVCFGSGW
jgi:hypothetical protein